jgi:uncharacterized repeat protein (TIGR03803 family)
VQANNGKLYGTTVVGGSINRGVIFSFDPSTSTYTKLKDFGYNDFPLTGSFIQASNGKLYGLMSGGSSTGGAIVSFDPSSSTYTRLKYFGYPNNDINGSNPSGSLMQASDGKLYGMTSTGGAYSTDYGYGYGVIFSLTLPLPLIQSWKILIEPMVPIQPVRFIELNGALTKTSVNFSGKKQWKQQPLNMEN